MPCDVVDWNSLLIEIQLQELIVGVPHPEISTYNLHSLFN